MSSYDDKTFFYDTIPYALVFGFVYLVSTTCSGYVFPSFNKLDEGKKSVWGSSCNSLLLSMWVPFYTIKCGLEHGKYITFDFPLSWTNASIIDISKIMMGYFIVDGTVCFYMREKWGPGWSAFAIHHVSGAWYIRSCLFNGVGYGSLLAMNITEISNFFNMLRFFIGTITDEAGASITKRFPKVELVNGLLFSASFFVLRIYGFTHIGWWSLIHERAELAKQSGEFQVTIHCCFIIGITLQFYWMYLIAKGLYKLLAGKSGKKKTEGGAEDNKIVKND